MSLSKFTLNTYLSHISKIRQFRANLDTDEIDEHFLEGYREFMLNRQNKAGTVYRSLAVLRKFVNMLRKNGTLKNSPFENFRMPRVRNRRDFLEIGELRALYDGYFKKNQEMRRNGQTGVVVEFQTNDIQQNPNVNPEF